MRILKIVLIVLLIIIGLFLLISLFLPGKYDVSRTININAPQRAVYSQVNDFKNWEAWSPWLGQDSTMVLKYGSQTAGKGASYSWKSEDMGNGNMQMNTSTEDTIRTTLNFEGQDPANGYWYFTEVGKGRTEVTWGLYGELGFFERFFGLFMEGQIGGDFETGLGNLKYLVESQKTKLIELPVNTVSKDSIVYFGITEDVTMADMAELGSELFARNYSRILAHIGKKADSVISGAPFAIFHTWDENTRVASIEFAIPVQTDMEGVDDIRKRVLASSEGLEVNFLGPYSLTGQAHAQIEEYADVNGIELGPIGIEFYVTDPGTEADTSKWLTKVYYPNL